MTPNTKSEFVRRVDAALSAIAGGNAKQARDLLESVLAEDSTNHNALHLLGLLDCQEGARKAGIERIRTAIAMFPRFPAALNNLAVQLRKAGRLAESADAYRQALALEPGNLAIHANLANVLRDLGERAEAIAQFRRALELQPDAPGVRFSLALLLRGQDDAAALEQLEALVKEPREAPQALAELADLYRTQGKLDQSLDCFSSSLRQDASNGQVRSEFISTLLQVCSWEEAATEKRTLLHDLVNGTGAATPFPLLSWHDDPALHHLAATRFSALCFPTPPALWRRACYRHRRIRVAYLSADLRMHAVPHLIASVFEQHDRSAFDIRAVSFGQDQPTHMRTRLIRAFERFDDVQSMTEDVIARELRKDEIDIAIDLNGHTKDARLGIFAARPAPVQVTFLGYPGTTGAPFFDYVLADPFVLPHDQQPFYSEHIVHLPECYQPNDVRRPRPAAMQSRTEVGLPHQGFVFCCFNNTYKVQPAIFAIWMRILAAVPGSVLWLLGDNKWATENLRNEAVLRGIDPARLIFAQRLPPIEHLARYRHANLLLDTLPYNAHTTAAEALWMDLPVLTCPGRSFAARVAGSLLRNVGLPELVTSSLEDYEALAIRLATHPDELAALRTRLMLNRATAPLFDSERFTRHLEAAFRQMHEIAQRGEKPRPFDVPALPRQAG